MKKSTQRQGKKLYLLLAVTLVGGGLFAFSGSALAQTESQEPTEQQISAPGQQNPSAPASEENTPAAKMPALSFEKSQLSFGSIQEGETVELVFPVKNTSEETIRIVEIRAGCGCTATKGNPNSIAPGEETAIRVQFNSQGRIGPNNRTVAIITDDPNQTQYNVSFEGRVTSDLTLSTNMLNFHELEMEKPSSLEFILTTKGERPVKIISAVAENPHILVEQLSETETTVGDEKAVDHKFNVTVPGDMPQGDFYTRVIVTTDHAKAPVQYVNLRGRVMGNFDFSPNRLFAVMNKDTELERRMTIVSRNGESFEVQEIEQNVDIPIELTIEPGANQQEKVLVANFKAPDTPKTINGNIRLLLKQGEEGKISPLDIPVIAVVREPRPAAPGAQSSNAAPSPARAAQ